VIESAAWVGQPAMTTSDILSKLTRELDAGIETEVQVVYLLAGIRKLIERDKAMEQYPDLKFHCDWALHSSLGGTAAKQVLRKFDAAHTLLRDKKIELRELPAELGTEIDRISKMRSFEEDLSRFLDDYGLPPLTKNRPDGWPHFLHLYAGVVEDIPLVVSLPAAGKKQKAKQGAADGAPKHISHVVVHFDQAREIVGREVLFRVTWTIHDKNGQSGSIFIFNSFSSRPE
jgi:hypothetical protein